MIIYDNWKVKDEVSISETFIPKNQPKFELKWVKNGHFYANFIIGVSADLAEYSVPNIRWVLAEYSAEYSVFGRTLEFSKCQRQKCLKPKVELYSFSNIGAVHLKKDSMILG